MKKAEQIAFLVVAPLYFLSLGAAPFVKLLTTSTNFVVRLFGIDPLADERQITEEEIRMLVDVGGERGAIDETEKEMINNIFEFDNKVVSEIMTHRTDSWGIPITASLKDIIEVINETKFAVPVYEDDIDNIVGILNIKDLIQLLEGRDENFSLEKIMRQPYFVPASKRLMSS